MKKYIRNFSLLLVIVLYIPCTVFASGNDDEIISFDEYYTALKDEYAKYGMDFEILDADEEVIFTQEILNEQIEIAKEFRNGLKVKAHNTYDVNNPVETKEYMVQPRRIMPVDYNWGTSYTISSPDSYRVPGYMDVYIGVYGEVNVQNSLVMSYYGYWREDFSMNVSSTGLDVTTRKTDGGVSIYVVLDGSVRFSWTEPTTNITQSTTAYGPFIGTSFRPEQFIY